MAPHTSAQFRAVCHNDHGPLNVYSFHPASYTGTHYHNLIEIGLCLRGRGVFVVENQIQNYQAGDIDIVFPYQKHFARIDEDDVSEWHIVNLDFQKMIQTSLSPIFCSDLSVLTQREIGVYGIFHPQEHPNIVRLVRQLIKTITVPGELAVRREIFLLTQLMMELALDSLDRPPYPRSGSRQNYSRIEPSVNLVQQKICQGEKVRVSDMSQACLMSGAYFRRLFHSVLGCSPQKYINDVMIAQAKFLLLETGDSILEIANYIGFNDASGFNRAFLRACGMTPSAFRVLHQMGNGGSQSPI